MKKLIVVTHPHLENSIINQRWVEELEKYPEEFVIHQLYKEYPTANIDSQKEQQLLEKFETIIFQFPVYWFSSPPLLKQWTDDVYTYGWAYGSQGNKMRNKKIAIALSVGGFQEDYTPQGRNQVTLHELLFPFKTTAKYVHANYIDHYYAFFGAEHQPNSQDIEQGTMDYIHYLRSL